MITTQILTRNNGKTIQRTLESILPLQGKIIIADLGSTDNTIQIARKFDATIISSTTDNRANLRNECIRPGWNFYIEPWEILVNPFCIPEQKQSYSFQIINNQIIVKEVRLWYDSPNIKFENEVCELINDYNFKFIEKSIIFSNGQSDLSEAALDTWINNHPTLSTPYYYRAFLKLQSKKYTEFLKDANQFLFLGGTGIPASTMRYYASLVQLYEFNNIEMAIRNIIQCLDSNILMAEFWCLLADAFYKSNQYAKAHSLYENAIILGGRRLNFDAWPMDISKYKSYPQKMMQSCKELIEGQKILIGTTKFGQVRSQQQ
jgi:glycosyltransferase involved in cell wall biosynthesis